MNHVHKPCRKENRKYETTGKNSLWIQESNYNDAYFRAAFHNGDRYIVRQPYKLCWEN